MLRIVVLLLITALVGCTTTPMPCDVKVKGQCREMSPSEKGGAGTRGHEETPKDIK